MSFVNKEHSVLLDAAYRSMSSQDTIVIISKEDSKILLSRNQLLFHSTLCRHLLSSLPPTAPPVFIMPDVTASSLLALNSLLLRGNSHGGDLEQVKEAAVSLGLDISGLYSIGPQLKPLHSVERFDSDWEKNSSVDIRPETAGSISFEVPAIDGPSHSKDKLLALPCLVTNTSLQEGLQGRAPALLDLQAEVSAVCRPQSPPGCNPPEPDTSDNTNNRNHLVSSVSVARGEPTKSANRSKTLPEEKVEKVLNKMEWTGNGQFGAGQDDVTENRDVKLPEINNSNMIEKIDADHKSPNEASSLPDCSNHAEALNPPLQPASGRKRNLRNRRAIPSYHDLGEAMVKVIRKSRSIKSSKKSPKIVKRPQKDKARKGSWKDEEIEASVGVNPPKQRRITIEESPIGLTTIVVPNVGDTVWVMVSSNLNLPWSEGKVTEVKQSREEGGEMQVMVELLKDEPQGVRMFSGKHVAYGKDEAAGLLSVGTRCVAIYREDSNTRDGDTDTEEQGEFYPAVIGEAVQESNGYRYLVFYDDGYALYLDPSEIRVVCQANKDVWLDVLSDNDKFIKKYLETFPNRSMTMLEVGQKVNIELAGGLQEAEVVSVDCALAGITFPGSDGVLEWIYRGSTRLQPVISELDRWCVSVS